MLERVANRLSAFPGYARIHGVWCSPQPWTIDEGLITPTLKLKRTEVYSRFEAQIEALYADR